jgi:hypothetical protein
MFEFNHDTPRYNNYFYKLADAISGSVFLIAGFYAYNFGLQSIGFILSAVSITSMTHIFIPWRLIRILDYALAVTLVFVCLMLVVKSNFYYPYAIFASLTCGISFVLYALYQKQRFNGAYSLYYYFWHVGALATCVLSITAFIQSI